MANSHLNDPPKRVFDAENALVKLEGLTAVLTLLMTTQEGNVDIYIEAIGYLSHGSNEHGAELRQTLFGERAREP